ncbi:hypothetical protein EYC80_009113 [Monilinia laxa]|uniref:LAGLIDADG endonuclease n=1 Tax=Monilinia laxa TaxID=61186 RepID=A0A5N6K2H3_MONLA|nr:hypothetical protein EYC80_009113 [Monilinia laxa]
MVTIALLSSLIQSLVPQSDEEDEVCRYLINFILIISTTKKKVLFNTITQIPPDTNQYHNNHKRQEQLIESGLQSAICNLQSTNYNEQRIP